MDYILQLRKYIGHRPILMVGVAILVLDRKNRLLMSRSDTGCWGKPGGSMEPGEIAEETAKRETLEETNLEVEDLSLFGVFSGPELYYKYPNGDEVYNVTIAYISQDWRGDLKLNGEHTKLKWFAADEIPGNISPPIRPILDKYKNFFKTSIRREP